MQQYSTDEKAMKYDSNSNVMFTSIIIIIKSYEEIYEVLNF